MKMELANFPEDIIIDIFLRLPVKTLMNIKYVRKSWRALISSSQFAKTHLDFSRKSNNPDNFSVVLEPTCVPKPVFTCSLSSILSSNNVDSNPVEIDFLTSYSFRSGRDRFFNVVGTCNGLLCALSEGTDQGPGDIIILCNPSTKKLKRVPTDKLWSCSNVHSYGFGHDKLNDDYKVIKLTRAKRTTVDNSDGDKYDTQVKVYSLRDDCWRNIEGLPSEFSACVAHINVGGVFHFIGFDGKERFILSLDVASYTYDTLELPVIESVPKENDCSLWELTGCLGIIFHDEIKVDIWVMKEYGVKESWNKLVAIALPVPLSMKHRLRPIFMDENGEVILSYDSYVMIYTPRDKTLSNLEIGRVTSPAFAGVTSHYMESLVSLRLKG